jgi:hypothetical protein
MNSKGSVYLIQPAELIGTNRYKIGCSKKGNLDRCKNGYKNGTRYIIIMECDDPYTIEKQIKQQFNINFELLAGKEYFEGEIENMIKIFYEIVYNNLFNYKNYNFNFDHNLSEKVNLIEKEKEKENKLLIPLEINPLISKSNPNPNPKPKPMSVAMRNRKYYEKHKEKLLLKKKLDYMIKLERKKFLNLDLNLELDLD